MAEKRAFSNVCYEEIQRDPESGRWLVYTVSSDHLPSQYRSLKLYPAAIDDVEPKPEVVAAKPRFSSRAVCVILTSIYVVSVSIAITIACLEIRKVLRKDEWNNKESVSNSSSSSVTSITNYSDHVASLLISLRDHDQRTPCLSTCRAYSKTRFRSRCVKDFCVCEGEGYQSKTCLPIVQQCAIQRTTDGPTNAYLQTASVPVYSCTSEPLSNSNVHVISIYGNHFADQTVVSISGLRSVQLTLVLASHYPVNWNLKYDAIDLHRIIVISDFESSRSTVDNRSATSRNYISPEVTYSNMFVGYGDDRHNSNTTDMLRTVTDRFGNIRSFSGAAFADYFSLKI